MKDEACIFCGIAAGEIAADIVFRQHGITAFRDSRPQAPTHVLLIPDRHIESLEELEDAHMAGSMLLACRKVARLEGLNEGYRVVVNVGEHAGRVPHLHFHVLGGRKLSWPPG